MTIRNRYDIYYDILCAIVKGRHRITHIMYTANLSPSDMQKHIDHLINKGLIAYKKPYYNITRKGYEYINAYNALMEVID